MPHDDEAPAKSPQRTKVLYPRAEFCELASISISTLDRLIAAGKVKTVHIRRRHLIPARELDRLARTGSAVA